METYRVFISSTIEDLKNARDAVEQVLKDLEIFDPKRVEKLPAIDHPSRTICLEEVRNADAVVLIIGGRYGFIPTEDNPEGLSVTHLEYREATKKRKPVFAFILKNVAREKPVEKFLNEVESFERGVLRKEWDALEALTNEVRRALLWWIAREARRGKLDKSSTEVVLQHLDAQSYRELPLTIENLIEPPEEASIWLEGIVNSLKALSDKEILPRPTTDLTPTKDNAALSLRLSAEKSSSFYEIEISFPISPPLEVLDFLEEDKKKGVIFGFSVGVRPTPEGADAVELILKALLFALVEDPGPSTEMLVEASRASTISEASREQIVGAAAMLDIRNRAASALSIAERALELKRVSGSTISIMTADLMLASARAGVHGSRWARHSARGLHSKLLVKGIEQGVLGEEALYSLARMLLDHDAPRLAVNAYMELVRIAPQYDERWYWHRDVGILYYSLGEYQRAAQHYDIAIRLKSDDSELFRFAGDAYYYEGRWARALERYERALAIEPTETYFLDFKIEYAEERIRAGEGEHPLPKYKRRLASRFSSIGSSFAFRGFNKFAKLFFSLSLRISPLDYEASRWCALYANRKGEYRQAIYWLKVCLSWAPEDPFNRLNLVLNMIFEQKGKWTDSARTQAKAAIFHAGPAIRERFKISLVNTSNRDELMREFDTLVEEAKQEREERRRRRLEVLKPQEFGAITHFELRE